MSDTKRRETATMGYEVVQIDNDKLKLIEGRYAWSTKELRTLDGMILDAEDFEIIRNQKTGEIERVKDNRTIGTIKNASSREKILKAMMTKEDSKQVEVR